MAIRLKTEEGTEFSFDTVGEFMEFKKQLDEEEASKELEAEIEVPKSEPKFEVGDKIRVVSADDGSESPYHGFSIGSIGEVEEVCENGKLEVFNGSFHQTLLSHHYEKVESLGKDSNGEDLYEGDFVTGTEGNEYGNTNDKVVMEVLGAGESPLFKEANITVSIVGYEASYRVDSSQFIKLSDNLDEAKAKFDEIKAEGEDELLPIGTEVRMLSHSTCGDLRPGDIGTITDTDEGCFSGLVYSVRVLRGGAGAGHGWVKKEDVEVFEFQTEFKVGDKVEVVGNRAWHNVAEGEVREITRVDSEEPKYNLSENSSGSWAHSDDIEHVHSPTEFKTGDIVKVTESFEDTFKDRVTCGAVYNYDENLVFGEPFVGTVFLGDNKDKIELVCRAEDRLDKY